MLLQKEAKCISVMYNTKQDIDVKSILSNNQLKSEDECRDAVTGDHSFKHGGFPNEIQ